MRGQRAHRSAWTWAVAALTLVASSAHATSIRPVVPAGAGVAGIAALGPEFVARRAWISDLQTDLEVVANPGEFVRVHVSMQNAGFADAVNARMTMATEDPDVDISGIGYAQTRWVVGATREYGYGAVIAAGAEPHDVTAIVTVTADNGGSWKFVLTFPIVAPPLAFVKLDGWIDDPLPDGDADGRAEAGERVRVGVRFRNDGTEDATDVRVTLTILDADATPVAEEGIHTSWPAGEERETAFLVDITSTAETHDAPMFITITVDGADPWQFSISMPIAGPRPDFSLRNFWTFDPAPGGNGDGAAAPGERVYPRVRLRNDGDGDGRDVRVSLSSSDPDVTVVVGEAAHTTWPLAAARNNEGLVLDIAGDAIPHDASLVVDVVDGSGSAWRFDVAMPITPRTVEFAEPNFWFFDHASGGPADGLVAPDQRVFPRLDLRNVGIDDANDVRVTLSTDDPDIAILTSGYWRPTWPAGATETAVSVITIAPDAEPHDVALVARVTAAHGGAWEFNVGFPIGPPRVDIAYRSSWLFDPEPGGNRDMKANPGERVLPRVRLTNWGPSAARNVRASLTTDDPAVTVIHGETTHARWEPWTGMTLNAYTIDIAPDAVPHDVTATVSVSADSGGPWQFTFVFPIVDRPVAFAQRNAWVFDPTPGGDKDGRMEAGERLFPRIRLRNTGIEEGRNVTVRLTTPDRYATVVTGEVYHETWPAGEARNNDGFVVDINRLAEPHDVEFTVTVEADGGVSEAFQYTFPIVSPPVQVVGQNMWLYDPKGRDGIILPGEPVWPRLRLRNIGSEPATGLRATLIATDDDITVKVSDAIWGVLAPGNVWDVKTLRLRVDAAATPHDSAVAIVVAADNGGPWRFEIPMALSSESGLRLTSVEFDDSGPGGNDDGQVNAGEAAALHINVANDKTRNLSNVRVTAAVDDPDMTVTGVVDPVADWRAGSKWPRPFSFMTNVAVDAAPHDVDVAVTITADDADPIYRTVPLSITSLPPDFALRNAWVWDPAPGADGDGEVNPGERVFPRVRLKNVGLGAGRSVSASLVILDSDVEVISGFVTHDSWPAGEARNNNGLVLDISPNATPHEVHAVLSVSAEDVDPRQFSFTFPIVAAQVATTALLANFPNPFNPETWIPFDLSEAADVTVTVYDARGMVIRRLDLGRLAPGPYRDRRAAAYWDGRNDVGEPVTSGAYVYELRAGAHRDMRRMIVRK